MSLAVSPGFRVDYTPSQAVAMGTVVIQGQLVGFADRPLPANQLGALAVYGVFSMPKATGATTALTVGTVVYWDAVNSRLTTTVGSNVRVGKVAKAAADADARVDVLLVP